MKIHENPRSQRVRYSSAIGFEPAGDETEMLPLERLHGCRPVRRNLMMGRHFRPEVMTVATVTRHRF